MHTICKIVACEKEKSDKKKIGFHEYTSAKKKKRKKIPQKWVQQGKSCVKYLKTIKKD